MPPLPGKTKPKGRDQGRSSRSRNTTPSSNVSAPISTVAATNTAYLDIPVDNLTIHSGISYDDILERHGGGGGIPDPKHLEAMADNLKTLSQRAETRGQACDGAMREVVSRQKEIKLEEERSKEKAIREKAAQEAAEKESLRRAAEEEEEGAKSKKALKLKKKKEQSVKEERPLTHGAHGVARQDGSSLPSKGVPEERKPGRDLTEPDKKRKLDAVSGSSSPLSPASQATSPTLAQPKQRPESVRPSRSPSSSSLDSHQPPPAPSIPQFQTFGPDPLTFDDPTIYHIRKVTDDMADEEKKEIYCVSHFPHDDLSHLIAGTPPDKDFSNAKPSNQVNANTFAAYIEPYLRPFTEEDMAYLKERGDRVTPFVPPPRGKKFYTEVWAEEDGSITMDKPLNPDKLPPNQARGSLENMDDEVAETEQISSGPMLSRLISALRFENRPPTEEKSSTANGMGSPSTNGVGPSDTLPSSADPFTDPPATTIPPATFMPDSNLPTWKSPTPKISAEQMDERIKAELRHLGFLAPDSEPDYDAHYDDEVAERLRKLQVELRRVSIINGARKARVLELANERMAHQEYSTILEDLDGQVQQAYLKRTRTLGKGKKNTKRPGGASGASHYNAANGAGGANGAGTGTGAGVQKPGIGDVARQLMTRRERWEGKIGPVFGGDVTRVRGRGEGIFGEEVMAPYLKREAERWDEEGE